MAITLKPALITLTAILALSACGQESDSRVRTQTHQDVSGMHNFAKETIPVLDEDYVDNFVLLDHKGASHELFYHYDSPGVVIMVQGNGCPIVRNLSSDIKDVRDEFESKGFKFYMLNANLNDDRSEIVEEASEYGYDIPILKDETQLIAASMRVTRTAEVFVIDPQGGEILYRGPVNDRITYERQKQDASNHYLKDALNDILAENPIETPARATKGCIVNLKDGLDREAHAKISYSDTIAPILMENCATCHQDGGIGPWAMTDYSDVEGFAPMIREVVRTQRMPPWSADPEIGEFQGTRRLSIEDQQKLVRWVEAGAPRGDGPDPLAERENDATVWELGEPDLIIEAPSFKVPATGVVDYQFPSVANPEGVDRWVKAVTVIPGDKSVVHHVLVGSSPTITADGQGDQEDVFDNFLYGFAPGTPSYQYPESTGIFVEKGGEYRFQFHYTPSGKPATDTTKVGLYFHDEKPEHVLRQQVILNPRINIPAGVEEHTESAYFEFDHDAEIYFLFPHAHFRGKSSKFDILYPDGRRETVLSVPKYDFNWQHNYPLKESIKVPAGTKLIHETIYDNSEKNFANPDSERNVPWGLQSADEMLYGSFFFRWTEETHDNVLHDPLAFDIRQLYGFADADMDGRLAPEEMPGWLRRAWKEGKVTRADFDKDGALAFNEFYAMQKFRQAQGGGN